MLHPVAVSLMELAPSDLRELFFTPIHTQLGEHSSCHTHVLILPLCYQGALHFGQTKNCQGCAEAQLQVSCAVPCPAQPSL